MCENCNDITDKKFAFKYTVEHGEHEYPTDFKPEDGYGLCDELLLFTAVKQPGGRSFLAAGFNADGSTKSGGQMFHDLFIIADSILDSGEALNPAVRRILQNFVNEVNEETIKNAQYDTGG